jgi:hypothetical protein
LTSAVTNTKTNGKEKKFVKILSIGCAGKYQHFLSRRQVRLPEFTKDSKIKEGIENTRRWEWVRSDHTRTRAIFHISGGQTLELRDREQEKNCGVGDNDFSLWIKEFH